METEISFSAEHEKSLRHLVRHVYEGIASDLGRCHIDDFLDAFNSQVYGQGWRPFCFGDPRITERAVKAFTEPETDGEREWAEQIVRDEIEKYADKEGMLRP